jgi:dTDP-glucose pyrophosphorylase
MINDLVISRGARLRDALRQLETAASKTLFVVEDGLKLFGTLTDGDVRRWILSGGDIEGIVDHACNRQPYFVAPGFIVEDVRREMLQRNITCVPVVAEDGQIVDILLWERIFSGEPVATPARQIDVPVVIMAGGKGTRLAPFTTVLPKPLIPLGDKTVIELIIDSFRHFGVNDFYLSVNYKSRIIKSYFEELDPPYNVSYIYEDKPLGTAGSLHALADKMKSDFIVTNCDVIIRVDCYDLLAHHRKENNDITLVASLKNYSIPYGVCEIENGGHLKAIKEKPEYNFLVNTGLYVLKPDVLGEIPKDEVFHITDLIEKIRAQGRRVGVFPISDKAWIDTGEWAQYRSAVAQLTADRRQTPR